jgi:polyisoprenoid-binding protein YceI
MRALQRALPLALVCLLMSLQSALAQVWTLEDGSQIRFTFLQQGSPVEGRFDRFTADITFDPDNLGKSLVEVEIDTTSIDTGHKDRDTLLRSSAFFDVQRWPMAHFASGRITHRGGNAYETKGQLTIRDVTKNVLLPFTLVIGDDPGAPNRLRALAKGELTISRLDYGVGQGDWASTKTVGEKVVIDFEIQASRLR